MKSTFKVLYYLKKGAAKQNGCVPVMGRITVDGQSTQFSTKLEVRPEAWDIKNHKVKGKGGVAEQTNRLLDGISSRLYQIYRDIQERDLYVTAEKVKNTFLGFTIKEHTLLKMFDQEIREIEESLGVTTSLNTLKRYRTTRDHLAEFVKTKYRVSDCSLLEIDHKFLTDWERFLRINCQCNVNTTGKYLQRLRRMILIARNNGWIQSDPFINYKIHFEAVDRGYLTKKELSTIMQKEFPCDRLTAVRDIFIFSCFSGLSYVDVQKLTLGDIETGFDGKLWIITRRAKTNVDVRIPLLDIPIRILEKYKNKVPGQKALPVLSNQRMNSYLKEIGDVCGIDKNLTFHLARHTFATTVTLTNGVPIETVSKMLGHTNITTTQIYARIVSQKMSTDMALLAGKLTDLGMKL